MRFFLACLIACATGCVRLDRDHCANKGDPRGYCDGQHEVAYCSSCEAENNGCTAKRPSDMCDPVGGVADTGDATTTTGMTTDVSMSASMSTTTVDPTTTMTMSTTESMDSSTGDQPPGCGNGVVDEVLMENCDMDDVPAENCEDVGLMGDGTVGCYPQGHPLECTYDLTQCTGAAQCGNDIIEGAEQCDGDNLARQTCETLSEDYIGGTLTCVAPGPDNQCTYNTSGCMLCIMDGEMCRQTADCCSGMCLLDHCAL